MSFYAIVLTKPFKLYKIKLSTIILPQHLNLPTSLISQEILKLLKLIKDPIFTFGKMCPCPSRIVINE
jgi:hypothetical protein